MEYPLSEEHQMFRDTMKRFVDEEMIPVEMETIGEDGELKPEWREKFHARSKELGLWKMEVPEESAPISCLWSSYGNSLAARLRCRHGVSAA